ncbi:MAG: hypothetical protein LBS36_07660 [Oscillospiraceae bacterium]|jgi:hypothetical protein|nr:hypothetical protein [Oscillospiraceae bacterium]
MQSYQFTERVGWLIGHALAKLKKTKRVIYRLKIELKYRKKPRQLKRVCIAFAMTKYDIMVWGKRIESAKGETLDRIAAVHGITRQAEMSDDQLQKMIYEHVFIPIKEAST